MSKIRRRISGYISPASVVMCMGFILFALSSDVRAEEVLAPSEEAPSASPRESDRTAEVEIGVVVAVEAPSASSEVPSEAPASPPVPTTAGASPSSQEGGRVVLMVAESYRSALAEALQLELFDRRLDVISIDPPEGETAIARAANAQEAARRLDARAALWIEQAPATAGTLGTLVRAVGADSQEVRHALLPNRYDRVEPRVVAVVASSLLEELNLPPVVPYSVDLPEEDAVVPSEIPEPVEVAEPPAVEAVSQSATLELRPIFFAMDFVPRLGMSTALRLGEERRLSLNILGSAAGAIRGFEGSALLNITRHHMIGVQTSGLVNIVGGPVRGFQVGGVLNFARGDLLGAQWSGVANIIGGDVRGLQAGGVFNVVSGDVSGVQAAGVFNFVRGQARALQLGGVFNHNSASDGPFQGSGVYNYARGLTHLQIAGVYNHAGEGGSGVQGSGVANFAGGGFRGLQASGVANVVVDELVGVQATGVTNVAQDVRGAQLGLVNVARGDVHGLQMGLVNVARESSLSLGLVNVVRDGRYHLDITGHETGFINASFKHGGRYLHNIYSVGVRVQDGQWSYGFGIGGHIPFTERVFLDIDLLTHSINEGSPNESLNLLNQLRAVVGIQVFRRLAITLGLSYNVLFTSRDDGGADYPLFGDSVFTQDPDITVRGWPGFQIGLQIF